MSISRRNLLFALTQPASIIVFKLFCKAVSISFQDKTSVIAFSNSKLSSILSSSVSKISFFKDFLFNSSKKIFQKSFCKIFLFFSILISTSLLTADFNQENEKLCSLFTSQTLGKIFF